MPEDKRGGCGLVESVTRHRDEGPAQETQRSHWVLEEEWEENFLPMKMAARSHTVRSCSATSVHVNVFFPFVAVFKSL